MAVEDGVFVQRWRRQLHSQPPSSLSVVHADSSGVARCLCCPVLALLLRRALRVHGSSLKARLQCWAAAAAQHDAHPTMSSLVGLTMAVSSACWHTLADKAAAAQGWAGTADTGQQLS
jgi:hypothetical protein